MLMKFDQWRGQRRGSGQIGPWVCLIEPTRELTVNRFKIVSDIKIIRLCNIHRSHVQH